jgi:hypothetical protein
LKTEDTSTLNVLETLSSDADIHQRKIAAKTGLNLAKVNFVMKKRFLQIMNYFSGIKT